VERREEVEIQEMSEENEAVEEIEIGH